MSDYLMRMDISKYEILANEGETFTISKAVEKAWENAASCVDSPSAITILQDNRSGKLYVGYHRTLSELTIPELMRLGQYILPYDGLLDLEIQENGKEAWMIFMWPWRIVKKSSAGDLQKKIKRVEDLINKIFKETT